MARISSYPKDTTIQDNDAWVGTASPNRQTKNFLASDVAKYLNIKGKISISAQMVYEFKSDPNEAGTGDFYGVSDNTDFSTITSLNISATDKGNQNVVNFITYLVDSDILISEQKNISSFGHYKITAYTDNGDGFYTLTLSYLGGGGSVGNKKFYDIANFSIAKLGDITAVNAGTYLNGGGSSGDVTLNHDLTSRTNTTSSVTPGYGGTFTAIDSVVTNTTGHITTVNTKTVTIPDSGVDGNGTTNYVAKWLDADTIQNSIIFDNGTNVGIGTASPTKKLDIISSGSGSQIQITSPTPGIKLIDSNLTTRYAEIKAENGNVNIDIDPGQAEGVSYFSIDIDNSEKFRINKDGNVGIGTTSPDAKLSVNGGTDNLLATFKSTDNLAYISFQDNNTTSNVSVALGASNDNLVFFTGTAFGSERMRIDSTGKVGIATTNPQSQLQINGGDGLTVTASDGAYTANYFGRMQSDYGINALRLVSRVGDVFRATNYGQDVAILTGSANTGTSERMRVNSVGNVGIGTTAPNSKLDVVGYIKSSNNLTASTTKYGKFLTTHYNISEQDVLGLAIESTSSNNNILIGGGFSSNNTATTIKFFTAANSTTTTGSEKMRITSGGNVGIGTTSPIKKLHVNSGSTNEVARFESTDAVAYLSIMDNATSNSLQGVGSVGDALTLYSNNAERVRIDSSGDVGIGTNSPSQKLHVNGNLRVTGAYYDSNNTPGTSGQVLSSTVTGTDWVSLSEIQGVDGTGTANYVAKWSDSDTITNSLIYDNGTNVGIGTTTTPNFLLDIEAPGADMRIFNVTSNANTDVYIRTTGTAASSRILFGDTADPDIGNIIYRHNSDSLAFTTNSSEAMRITSTGNVGIGTTSPGAKLDVNGPGSFSGGSFSLAQDTVTDAGIVINQGNHIFSNVSGNYLRNIITHNISNNDIEIGQLHTNLINNIHLKPGSSGSVIFQCSGSEDMRVAGTGNVGINTTNPQRKLEVVGKIRVSDIIEWGWGGVGIIGSTTTNDVRIKTWNGSSTQDRLIVNGSGNVGIGTTSPGAKLDINGDSSYSSNYNFLSIFGDKTGGTAVTDVKGINLNIGSNDHVVGHDITNLYGAYINNITSGSSATVISNWYGVYVPPADPDRVSNRVSAYFGDKVGIGTTSPNYLLDVYGQAQIDGGIITNTGIPAKFIVSGGSLNDSTEFRTGNGEFKMYSGRYNSTHQSFVFSTGDNYTSGAERMRIDSLGRVNIGTTTHSTVGGNAKMTINVGSTQSSPISIVNGTTDGMYIRRYDSGGKYQIQTNLSGANTGNLSLQSYGGNVGIGTTDPNSIFEIRKDVNNGEGAELRVINNGTAVGTGQTSTITIGRNFEERNIKIKSVSSENYGIKPELVITQNQNATGSSHTEVLRINSSGNVGIGTTSPASKLEVSGDIRFSNKANGLYFGSTGSDGTWSGAKMTRVASHLIISDYSGVQLGGYDGTSYGPRLVVQGSGNVGIGTTSPTAKLQVSGSGNESVEIKVSAGTTAGNTGSISLSRTNGSGNIIQGAAFLSGGVPIGGIAGGVVGSSNTLAPAFAIQTPDSTNGHIVFNPRGTEKIRIASDGNVGIGTTSPTQKLQIYESGLTAYKSYTNTNAGAILTAYQSTSSPFTKTTDLVAGSDSTVPSEIRFLTRTNGTSTIDERVRITSTGNVGIGNNNPNYNLVIGDGTTDTESRFYHNDGAYTSIRGYGLFMSRSMSYIRPTTDESQTLNIGYINQAWATISHNSLLHTFGKDSNEFMRINSSGNVGIGTTSPNYKIAVAGAIQAGGVITYSKFAGSLSTTGYAVAGLITGSNGNSAGFTFTCFGHTGKYQKIVYSCYNGNGTWYTKKVIDEGTNDFDVEASADATTITFTFKSTSGSKAYTPRVTVEAIGHSINSTYA